MKKLIVISAVVLATLSATDLSAAGNGCNRSKCATKETKETLKFSAREFAGTEDCGNTTLELPAADVQPEEKKSGSFVKPADKTRSALKKTNSVN